MGFLNAALLALAAAAAVPLILHLFQRHQGPRVVFPALRYLRRAEKESARRIKLRQILLLALRVAAVVLLALAAARPLLRSGGATHPPTAVVIVIDNSLSSGTVIGGRRVLDAARVRALQTIAAAGTGDRFWLIRAAAPGEPAISGPPERIEEAIRETEASAAASDLGDALTRARALLDDAAGARAAEIQLLSDMQRSALPRRALPRRGPRLVVWSPAGDPPPNRGVVDVEVGGGLAPRAGERGVVAATIAGSGEDRDSATVRLVVDGRPTAAAIAPAGATALLTLPARQPGLLTGWVESDADALRGDDRRYFVARVEPPPVVEAPRDVLFLEDALAVLERAGRIRRVGAGSPADRVVAPGGVGAGALRAGRGVVVLAPATPLELPAANRRLAAAGIPWRFGVQAGAGEARITAGENRDELTRALADARVRQVYRLESTAGTADTVLLRLSDGSPLAVGGSGPDGGRYVVLATPLTTEATTIPTSAAMLPLLERLLGAWLAPEAAGMSVPAGGSVRLPRGVEQIERPDGTREAAAGGELYRVPTEPGIYRLLAGDRPIDAIAVNAPASETDLTRATEDRLQQVLPRWDLNLVDSADAWAGEIFGRRHGREVWWPLVLTALVLLLLESVVAGSGRGRPARRVAASVHSTGTT